MVLFEAKFRVEAAAYTVPGLIKGEIVALKDVLTILEQEIKDEPINSTPTKSTEHKNEGESGPPTVAITHSKRKRNTKKTRYSPAKRKNPN